MFYPTSTNAGIHWKSFLILNSKRFLLYEKTSGVSFDEEKLQRSKLFTIKQLLHNYSYPLWKDTIELCDPLLAAVYTSKNESPDPWPTPYLLAKSPYKL